MILARNFDEGAAQRRQRITKQNGVGNYLHGRWINSIFCHYFQENLKQRRFWATLVNRNWTFCTLEPWFWTNFGANRSLRVRTLSNTNLVVPRHIKKKKAYFWLTSVPQKGRCSNSLLTSNVRTVNWTPNMIITRVRLLLFLICMKDTGTWFLNKNSGKYSDVHP